MTEMLVLALDRDTAGHLAVAIRRHRRRLNELGHAEPVGLAELETVAQTVAKSHQQSPAFTVPDDVHTDKSDREYLTRRDISDQADVSISTVDRWLRTGVLPSTKHGHTRRVSRKALDQFLTTT